MKTMTFIGILLVAAMILGLSFWGGMGCERKLTKKPEPLSAEYIQSWGFKPIQGGGLVKTFTEIIPLAKPDTIVSTVAIISTQSGIEQIFIMGYVFQNRFMAVDVFYNRKDFDSWIELMPAD